MRIYTGRMAKATALDRQWLDELVERIVARFNPLRVVLFGSYARGDFHAASDVDLLVVVDAAADCLERGLEFRRAIGEERLAVEAHIYTAAEYARMKEAENPLILQAEREGKVLYDQQ